jgi:hypothetical protein
VAYVTEDPEQVERILYGMHKKYGNGISMEEFRYWFDIIPARRLRSTSLALLIEDIRKNKTITLGAEFNHYEVEPLIVLDTANATLDLDNENDNAEAGKAISAIKSTMGRAAIWIVAHTSKVASRTDVEAISARGASAFEGDANAVCYILNVETVRFMVLGKRRFEASYTEIRFDSETHSEVVDTPWGIPQSISYRYGLPVQAEEGERESLKEEAKEDSKDMTKRNKRQEILTALADNYSLGFRELASIVRGKHDIIRAVLKELLADGLISVCPETKNKTVYRVINPRPHRSND